MQIRAIFVQIRGALVQIRPLYGRHAVVQARVRYRLHVLVRFPTGFDGAKKFGHTASRADDMQKNAFHRSVHYEQTFFIATKHAIERGADAIL